MYKVSSISKILVVAILVIIIIVAAFISISYLVTKPPNVSFSIASSTSVGTAGSPITFTVISQGSVTPTNTTWNFGDGNITSSTATTISHTYSDGGNYLVSAQVTASGGNFIHALSGSATNDMELFPLEIQSNVTLDQSQNISVPTINFESTSQVSPVVSVGQSVALSGGYLQQPTNTNWTIQSYSWNFGDGKTQQVVGNATGDYLPSQNVSTSFSQPGLYPVSLTLVTNDSQGETASTTTFMTVAAQSSSTPYAVLASGQKATNPNIITSAENVPGGPYSFDPQIDSDNVGSEVLDNIMQQLIVYNGSSLTSFIPEVATQLPTVQNGEVTNNMTAYTFQIRDNQFFSNGDPLTAYDVWYSFMRGIAFSGGTPGTLDWVYSQFLIPGVQNGTASPYTNNTYAAAFGSISYNNVSNTVTFQFNTPMSPTLVYEIMASGDAPDIIDANYAISVGAGWTPATWTSYENQANAGDYNVQMEWSPIGSGPYMIATYTPGQSVELVPNPHYGGVPGIPKVNDTVVIDWVKDPEVALLMLQDGQADAVSGLPSSEFTSVQQLQSQGLAKIYSFEAFHENTYAFNDNISKTLEQQQFGSGFNEPSNYFADPATRFTFIDSFDYSGYLNNILGNNKYNAVFGSGLTSIILPGELGYPTQAQIPNPQQNLADAKGNFSLSAWHDEKITVPIIVVSGDPVDTASAEEWAATLGQVSGGNITATVEQIQASQLFGNLVPGANPMGCYFLFYEGANYPDPGDEVSGAIQQGGIVASSNAWSVQDFMTLTPSNSVNEIDINGTNYSQSTVFNWMNGNFTEGGLVTNTSARLEYYLDAQHLAVDLGLYVYVANIYTFLYWSSHLGGIQYEENPATAGAGILWYYWMTKS